MAECANIYDYGKEITIVIVSLLWVVDADDRDVMHGLWGQN